MRRKIWVDRHSYIIFHAERLMCTRLEDFMKNEFSSLLTGFKKNHSTQHCLVVKQEECQKKIR